ncbi:glycosyltransferase family 9 protein [Paenarthrobacter sp. Z7-10]|nr:glycosyltransferase family 9 protein [Paenarthrobacter sp. Z7-10]
MSRFRLPATLGSRFNRVERIAVLRGGGLGDLFFALPAICSLAAAYPDAAVTLLGSPGHRALLQDRAGPIAAVEVLPAIPGIRDVPGDSRADTAAADEFMDRMRLQHFDLAVQLHGGGANSNPFVHRLEARHTVGCAAPKAVPLERNLPFRFYQHEALRWLEVASLAGAPAVCLEPLLEVSAAERLAALAWGEPGTRGMAVIHPGASDPRRCWPAGNFAQMAALLAQEGYQVLVIGDVDEVDLAASVVGQAQCTAGTPAARQLISSVAGKIQLPVLAGLLAECQVFLGNDSGPRHLAQAVGARTASIYWCGNVINAGPLSRAKHRIQVGWLVQCPVCGVAAAGEATERCGHDESFVGDVRPDAVQRDLLSLLAESNGRDPNT